MKIKHLNLKHLTLSLIATPFVTLSNVAQSAENEDGAYIFAPIVVTATRDEQNSFDLPVAIDVVKLKDLEDGRLQMSLSESLIRLPGITAQNRTQQAQDPQISSRGFGSRASFGVRGLRLYIDGIPLTMPDGQGQPGVVDLSAIQSVEVMRGPFSSLYGSSSGGVIQMFTKNAPDTPELGGTAMFGSYETNRQVLNAAGGGDNAQYFLNISNFNSDGYRDHSRSDKQLATAKFKIDLNESTKLTTLINSFDQDAQDPSGLTKADVRADREGVVAAVDNADTRVSRDHTQIGFNLEHSLNDNNTISWMSYLGQRHNKQILATNSQGTNARESKISRDFYGSDLRWDNYGKLFDKSYNISLGLNYGRSKDDRSDTNVLANSLAINTLNRDEDNTSYSFDQYLQGKLSIADDVDIHAGVRHTKVNLDVDDHFITATNLDNSGSIDYKKTTFVMGALWKISPTLNLYANYGKGFETPTFFEAAYNSSNANAVPNLNLKAAESKNFEIGAKALIADNSQVNLNLFRITSEDELVVDEFNNGRTVYTNANDSKRTGAELSIESEFENDITSYFSYSLLNAKFDSDFRSNSGLIESGNRIPGTYRTQLYGEVAWQHKPWGFSTAFEGSYYSKVYVDDINSDTASSYTSFNLRAGFEQSVAHWSFKEFLRIENIFDKEYIGSVRINDRNARFFEPAAERNYLVGLSAHYIF